MKRENNVGDETIQGTIHVYIKMSQQKPLYNYHMLIKILTHNFFTFKWINFKFSQS
jgi:hypothetical protein